MKTNIEKLLDIAKPLVPKLKECCKEQSCYKCKYGSNCEFRYYEGSLFYATVSHGIVFYNNYYYKITSILKLITIKEIKEKLK